MSFEADPSELLKPLTKEERKKRKQDIDDVLRELDKKERERKAEKLLACQ